MGDKYLQVIFDTDLVTDAFELMYSNQEARLELESQVLSSNIVESDSVAYIAVQVR